MIVFFLYLYLLFLSFYFLLLSNKMPIHFYLPLKLFSFRTDRPGNLDIGKKLRDDFWALHLEVLRATHGDAQRTIYNTESDMAAYALHCLSSIRSGYCCSNHVVVPVDNLGTDPPETPLLNRRGTMTL